MLELNHPFALLADYARRSLAQAKGLPAQTELKTYWSGVGFSLAGHKLVAPMDEVAEIIVPTQLTRLPGVQSWVKGVSNIRGRLLPLIDLEAFFGSVLSGGRYRQRVLAVDKDELYSGLMVSEVYGMQHFPEDSFSQDIPPGLDAIAPFLRGSYNKDGQLWTVFSPFDLAADKQFLNAAAS